MYTPTVISLASNRKVIPQIINKSCLTANQPSWTKLQFQNRCNWFSIHNYLSIVIHNDIEYIPCQPSTEASFLLSHFDVTIDRLLSNSLNKSCVENIDTICFLLFNIYKYCIAYSVKFHSFTHNKLIPIIWKCTNTIPYHSTKLILTL